MHGELGEGLPGEFKFKPIGESRSGVCFKGQSRLSNPTPGRKDSGSATGLESHQLQPVQGGAPRATAGGEVIGTKISGQPHSWAMLDPPEHSFTVLPLSQVTDIAYSMYLHGGVLCFGHPRPKNPYCGVPLIPEEAAHS